METEPHRFLGIQMNHLGLSYEFLDLYKGDEPEPGDGHEDAPPKQQGDVAKVVTPKVAPTQEVSEQPKDKLLKEILKGRYAGIVTWFLGGQDHPEMGAWLRRQIAEGMRVAMFGAMGFTPDNETAKVLGVKRVDMSETNHLDVASRDYDILGFETEPVPSRLQLVPLSLSEKGLKEGRSLLELKDEHGKRFDGAAITSWGGFVWNPYELIELRMTDQTNWVINPLKFLRAALQLPDDVPVPDVTSEGGRRMLMVHIDGDGFASEAEIKSRATKGERYYGADVMLTDFLMRYKLPTTMSIIESETSPSGSFPDRSRRLEEIARDIMKLPYIEGATHTFTHPLKWGAEVNKEIERKHLRRPKKKDKGEGNSHSLTIKGYDFDLLRETRGSIDYINKRLMPPGKLVKVLLWSGDCMPPFEATEETTKNGYLNMNGGDTLLTVRNRSWTMMSSQGLPKKGWFQVHAPNQNENVYTNDWLGPFYGFERVVETFILTDMTHRFKPVDIYYHTYSGSKAASIMGLHKAYDWAVAQPFTHVYSSQYMRKVLDFEQTTIAREWATGDLIVRTGDHLRTLRQSGNIPFSKWAGSPGLAGMTQYRSPNNGAELDVTYLTLSSGEVRLLAHPDSRVLPYIAEANGTISGFARTLSDKNSETRFTINRSAEDNETMFSLAQSDGCEVQVDGHPVAAIVSKNSIYSPNNVANALKSETLVPAAVPVVYKHYEPRNNNSPDYLPSRHLVLVRCRL
jgi:hypothetical protein